MFAIVKLAALGAMGYVGYKYWEKSRGHGNAAFAEGQAGGSNFSQVRDAGPDAMADDTERSWSKADEESDESFPASDPPANY